MLQKQTKLLMNCSQKDRSFKESWQIFGEHNIKSARLIRRWSNSKCQQWPTPTEKLQKVANGNPRTALWAPLPVFTQRLSPQVGCRRRLKNASTAIAIIWASASPNLFLGAANQIRSTTAGLRGFVQTRLKGAEPWESRNSFSKSTQACQCRIQALSPMQGIASWCPNLRPWGLVKLSTTKSQRRAGS